MRRGTIGHSGLIAALATALLPANMFLRENSGLKIVRQDKNAQRRKSIPFWNRHIGPHQGAQEKARRVRQISRGIISADQVWPA